MNTREYIHIKSGYDLIKINVSEVLYIKADSDYTDIVTTNKTYVSTYPLRHWLVELDAIFAQIHKSYLVNTSHLEKVSGNKLFLNNAIELPIGRTYKKEFVERYLY